MRQWTQGEDDTLALVRRMALLPRTPTSSVTAEAPEAPERDVWMGVSSRLKCGCVGWQCNVYLKGTTVEVPQTFTVSLTRGIAACYHDPVRLTDDGDDLHAFFKRGVYAKCPHGEIHPLDVVPGTEEPPSTMPEDWAV